MAELFCPYVGLRPYAEADREYFFGRDRDQRIISSNLSGARLTILYGASGVGKSSVLQAGVIPRIKLKTDSVAVYWRRWQTSTFLNDLRKKCLESIPGLSADDAMQIAAAPSLDEFLFMAARQSKLSILLVLDQFEEYLLYADSDADNSPDGEFASAINREEVDARFLIGLREDGLWTLDHRFRARIANLLSNTLRLEHLNTAAAREAIFGPLRVYQESHSQPEGPVTVEDALADEILRQVRPGVVHISEASGTGQAPSAVESDRIETAFLQLVLTRLWQEEKNAGCDTLRLTTFLSDKVGGARTIVRAHVDRIMEQFSPNQREICSRIFQYLVTPSGTKIAQATADLISFASYSSEEVSAVLSRLADQTEAKILRRIDPPERYEIFHDVLAQAVLDWRIEYLKAKERREAEMRAAAEAEERARKAAHERELQQTRELLEAQQRRAEAETLRAEEQQKRAEAERERAALEARAAGRWRKFVAVLASLSVVLLAAIGVAFWQSRAAVKQRDIAKLSELQVRATLANAPAASPVLSAGTNLEAISNFPDAIDSGGKTPQPDESNPEKLSAKGLALYRKGDPQGALEALNKAVTLDRTSGNQAAELWTLRKIGAVAVSVRDYKTAMEAYRGVLALQQKLGRDPASESVTLTSMAQVSSLTGDLGGALNYLARARDLQHQSGNTADEATTLASIADLWAAQHNNAQALSYYQQALALQQQLGNWTDEAALLTKIGGIYKTQGDDAKAADYFNQSLQRPCGMRCGAERWAVKTLSDSDAQKVILTPETKSVAELTSVPAPTTSDTSRAYPIEMKTFQVRARLVAFKFEADHDIKMILVDLQNPKETMAAEMPDPACSGVCISSQSKVMGQVRQTFRNAFPTAESSRTFLVPAEDLEVEVTGVGFFDFNHGQLGNAKNCIELHPVLDIKFPKAGPFETKRELPALAKRDPNSAGQCAQSRSIAAQSAAEN